MYTSRPIPPLISRHAQDAAWYWSQIQADRTSPLVDFDRLAHFQRLLAAHLDGLRFAGSLGWELACKELDQWGGAAEAFPCWVLAFEGDTPKKIADLWGLLEKHPSMFPAVASALEWLEPSVAHPWMELWIIREEVPTAQAIALTAYGFRREKPSIPLHEFFDHSHPTVRAAACRAAGYLGDTEALPHLRRALRDDHHEVREQAALALLRHGRGMEALPGLKEALAHWQTVAEQEDGSRGIEAERRAQLLARCFGHALPLLPCKEMCTIMGALPPYLCLLAVAHHGDPAHIPLLLPFFSPDSPYNRRALWALCAITGLDAEDAGLCLPAVLPGDPRFNEEIEPYPGQDDDSGLPEPDPDALMRWWAEHAAAFPEGQRLLNGVVLQMSPDCLPLLHTGTQAQRFAAALHAVSLDSSVPWVDTRAPIALQRRCLGAFHVNS